MNPNQEIQIPLSKAKVFFLLLGSLAFVALGVWFLMLKSDQLTAFGPFRNPILIKATGAASVIFFGMCSVVGFRKILDTKPGLIIGSTGIIDNSSGVSAGFIAWSEISEIGTFTTAGQHMVVIKVHDPEKFVERGNSIQRRFNRANLQNCGTPICISANSLKLDFQELVALLETKYSEYVSNA